MNAKHSKRKRWMLAGTSAAAALLLLVTTCQKDETEENQRKNIESSINGKDYETFDGIYFKQLRHPLCDTIIEVCTNDTVPITVDSVQIITTCDTLPIVACQKIKEGDKVTFAYTAKVFRGITFATTDAAEAARSNIFPQPLATIVVGKDPLVEGVKRALLHTVVNDSVHILFPFPLGYGRDNFVGQVPPTSSQEWTIWVVKKE
ncbi:hypothetical protein AGMMS4956_02650 [Bacteroidia bacterium]|nr:hypothetical protein AGMMS4956_02650 [Bacteroidia bacterium]